MRAVVVDQSSLHRIRLADVDEPVASHDEALINIRAISLNLGETRRVKTSAEDGVRPGWDVAGEVLQAATNGEGPPAGSRVVGFLYESGGWAERAAVHVSNLAVLPRNVSYADASTLPVAGLTALYALERAPSLLGRRVLITGAAGGVGVFALQLASRAGADVTALIRKPLDGELVRELGARNVVISEDGANIAAQGPFDHILDSLGGSIFANAAKALAVDGELVTFGTSAQTNTDFNISDFYGFGGRSIYGFIIFHEVLTKPAGAGLARLLHLVKSRLVMPRIDRTYPFDDILTAVDHLWQRRITGKAVVIRED